MEEKIILGPKYKYRVFRAQADWMCRELLRTSS
jgi:hypothetical protein